MPCKCALLVRKSRYNILITTNAGERRARVFTRTYRIALLCGGHCHPVHAHTSLSAGHTAAKHTIILHAARSEIVRSLSVRKLKRSKRTSNLLIASIDTCTTVNQVFHACHITTHRCSTQLVGARTGRSADRLHVSVLCVHNGEHATKCLCTTTTLYDRHLGWLSSTAACQNGNVSRILLRGLLRRCARRTCKHVDHSSDNAQQASLRTMVSSNHLHGPL